MKIKTLLIALSVISFLSFSLTSCSEDGDMGIGGSSGGDPPPFPADEMRSGGGLQTDSIATYDVLRE